MKKKNTLFIFVGALAVATVIDIIDGYIPKIISSAALTVGILIMALGQDKPNRKVYNWLAYFFILIAFFGFAYRLMHYFDIL